MNYFGHVSLACRFRHSPGFLLGSMLPDFANIARCRVPSCSDVQVSDGIAFHYVTDGVFHSLPEFRELVLEATQRLKAAGVRKGPARASAHVGTELLLDALLATSQLHQQAFLDALAIASPGRLGGTLRWKTVGDAHKFESLRQRLLEGSRASDNHAVERLIARLSYSLADRPRLCLLDLERPALARWLHATAFTLSDGCAPLWSSLVRVMSSHWSD